MTFDEFFERHDFHRTHTGGGCYALIRTQGLVEIYVTNSSGAEEPTDEKEDCFIGVYYDGEEIVSCEVMGFQVPEFLKYVILTLPVDERAVEVFDEVHNRFAVVEPQGEGVRR